MSLGAKMPPRLAAVVLPVGLLGLVVACRGRGFVRRLTARPGHAGRDRRPARGLDARRALPGPARRDRHRRRLARLRLLHAPTIVLYGWEAGVIVGFAAPVMQLLEHRPPIRVAYNASVLAVAAVVAGAAIAPLRGDGAPTRLRPGRGRGSRPLHGQPAPDQPRRRRQRAEAVPGGRADEHLDHDPAVRADGLGCADARRPLAALAAPLRRRSSARCSRSRSTSARPSASCGRCGSR